MPDDWRSVANGLFEHTVTFGHNSGIEPGDKLVLYAAGWKCFFASGTAVSYPYEDTSDPDWPWRVEFELEHALPRIHNGLPLDTLNVDSRDLRVAMRRRSHIRLSEKEYAKAVSALGSREQQIKQRSKGR